MSACTSVLYLGLRRAALEWRAELEAAQHHGYDAYVLSDGELPPTGLPGTRTGTFSWGRTPDETAVQVVDQIQERGWRPAAVVCWGDRFVPLTAMVAQRLGLPGTGVQAALTCGDKAAQRRLLEPFGLNPSWRSGTTLDELRGAIAELGTPAVFKLAHSSGGRGTTRLEVGTDLESVFKATALNYLPSDAFVVESVVEGSEHSVAGIVRDGRIQVAAVADKVVPAGSFETVATVVPSGLGSGLDRVIDAAGTAVGAVGIGSGGFHVDLRLTADGPVVLEVGARLGGDLINSHLVPTATPGSYPYRDLLAVLSGQPLPPYRLPAAMAAMAMVLVPVGQRSAADLAAELSRRPGVREVTGWPSASSTGTLAVLTSVDDPGEVAAVADRLRAAAGGDG
jgi:biotin carboxylase